MITAIKKPYDHNVFCDWYPDFLTNVLMPDKNERVKSGRLYHYTSVSSAYNILENDTFRLSNILFCNDSTEGRMLPYYERWITDNDIDDYDDYVFCLCLNDDELSQWRGYCPNGGVSIGLDVSNLTTKSNTFNMRNIYVNVQNQKTHKNEKIKTSFFPVQYVHDSAYVSTAVAKLRKWAEGSGFTEDEIKYMQRDILPYMKNDRFHSECEFRLVVPNKNGKLDDCIKFYTKKEQIFPSMDIKIENIDNDSSDLWNGFGDSEMCEEQIEQEIHRMLDKAIYTGAVCVPKCNNQEELYNKFVKIINSYTKYSQNNIRIFCDGHLPITSITVSPSQNQYKIVDQLKRFCQSKYWLKKVEIKCSKIPFIP